jgi:peptidoglycan/xylan/chitin deacetylase (PgdA/CDA1 family)
METSTANDEGEPSGNSNFLRSSLFILLFLLACTKTRELHHSHYNVAGDSAKAISSIVHRPAPKLAKTKKRIYLTFDDGPNKGTKNVLDIVEQENVPATFFIVGEHVFASAEQARTWDSLQVAEHIELCNHSNTHALHNHYGKYYEYPDTVVQDMEKSSEALQLKNSIVRAPGRNCWRIDSLHFTDIKKSKAAIDSLQQAGFIVMGWDLEWHYDPKTLVVKNTADEMMTQIDSVFSKNRTKVPDNLVLLAHDQVYRSSADSLQLRVLVQKLKLRDEYELSLVNQYPGAFR